MRPREGRVQALNAGLAMAHGRYVTGLDDDDIVDPEHLAIMVRWLESPGAAPVVYGDYRVAKFGRGPEGALSRVSARECRWGDYRPGLLFETNPCNISLVARRSCYEQAGRFCPELGLAEDWEMWLRLAEHFPFHHLPALTVEVRERPGDLNLTARRLREKYLWDNLALFLHRGLVLLSAPKRPEADKGYARAMALLDQAINARPDILPLLNLRGLWTMRKPYAWFADQGRWFLELGEPELSRAFYGLALRLAPWEPKLWAGWRRAGSRAGSVAPPGPSSEAGK
jgi:tetratricopeptide (TPR) repeat protein